LQPARSSESTLLAEVLILGAHARVADNPDGHWDRRPVRAIGSDTLKPYTGSLPGRTGICMAPVIQTSLASRLGH